MSISDKIIFYNATIKGAAFQNILQRNNKIFCNTTMKDKIMSTSRYSRKLEKSVIQAQIMDEL